MAYALITGASKGIGKAIATELAARKHDVLLVARNTSALATLAQSFMEQYDIKANYLALDLTNPDAPQTLVTWINQHQYNINILINNAGYGLSGKFEDYTIDEHAAMMRINMHTPVALCSRLLPQLKKQPQSYILNIISSAAYQSVPGLGTYAASKVFMLSFTRSLRYELRKTSVSVTAVSPGSTDTDFAHTAKVGTKALKSAEKLNMHPQKVAQIAVDAMFNKKKEVITGWLNQLGAWMVWLLPKALVEKTAAGIYEID